MHRLLVILVVIGQLIWLAFTIPSLNILGDSYRRGERDKAMAAWAVNKTPATQAAFDREVGLLVAHRNFVDGLTVCVFLIVDVFGVFLFWKYGKSKRGLNAALYRTAN